MKRKRTLTQEEEEQRRPSSRKRCKRKRHHETKTVNEYGNTISHPVLECYYPRVIVLRQWLLKKLEERVASRKRRAIVKNAHRESQLLDNVLVGMPDGDQQPGRVENRQRSSEATAIESLLLEASQACGLSKGYGGRPVGTAASNGGGGRMPVQHEVCDVNPVCNSSQQ